MTGPRILLNITHGFQARLLLRSEVTRTLLERGAALVVSSRNHDEPYFREEFDHPRITLVGMPEEVSYVEGLLVTLRQYILMNPSLGATLNYKNEAFRRSSPKKYYISRIANAVLGRISLLRRLYMAIERRVFAGREWDALLAEQRPDLIVTGTPGYDLNDIHLLRAARRLGIRSAVVMQSWDNLSSKGYMGAPPDHLLAWSELMRREAQSYHDYPPDRVTWAGAPQFDHYHDLRARIDVDAWRARHGVPADRPLIVHGTINPAILPHEPAIVRQIVGAMRAGAFARPPHLWIRLHPQVVRGAYARNLDVYRALEADDVTVEIPPVRDGRLPWDLPASETEHLATLMAAADVVSVTSSTLAIDALCAGTPVVNVLFDGDEPFVAEETCRRFERYTHYAHLLATGGLAKAYDIDAFVAAVDRYVADPTADADGRARAIELELGTLDGQAGSRTATELLALATRPG